VSKRAEAGGELVQPRQNGGCLLVLPRWEAKRLDQALTFRGDEKYEGERW
jgi:hypothetical protein